MLINVVAGSLAPLNVISRIFVIVGQWNLTKINCHTVPAPANTVWLVIIIIFSSPKKHLQKYVLCRVWLFDSCDSSDPLIFVCVMSQSIWFSKVA